MKNIRSLMVAGAFAVLASPIAALAQMGPGAPPPQFEQARAQTRTAAMNDLSADHRAKVQAILAQVQSGSLDPLMRKPDAGRALVMLNLTPQMR